ncbi:hypothetical protein MC7420_1613 [Coleofasciculus chthonoplastes PCC 7420]|uniref:Uncharacterized protein n=1 Tax=Coleofasciculus chthonoplastes PCC 7420 TaxID=118168 RepID=B4W311_9CYAN|nr:hypothetical protein MC7420_1613 [Coleofasciculus chthonoplastes PCC 7420]
MVIYAICTRLDRPQPHRHPVIQCIPGEHPAVLPLSLAAY